MHRLFLYWVTEVLNSIASEFVFQPMCLVGVRMLSIELLAFPVTNILYGVKHHANASIWEYLLNLLIPGVGDLVYFSPLEDTLVPWNKSVFLYSGNSNPSVRLLSSVSCVSK